MSDFDLRVRERLLSADELLSAGTAENVAGHAADVVLNQV
jgi:hypothetical protein